MKPMEYIISKLKFWERPKPKGNKEYTDLMDEYLGVAAMMPEDVERYSATGQKARMEEK